MNTEVDEEPYFYLINEMINRLSNTDAEKVMNDFCRKVGRANPVVYFYENFLFEYDNDMKVKRGVFNTPESVVHYIIESVDVLLRSKFGTEGISDTRKIKYTTTRYDHRGRKGKRKQVLTPVERECHKVLILDPALGTGTFLYEVIRSIRYKFREDNNAGMWSAYVREHLIPRLFGFEIMVAPYTVAHFNILSELKGKDLNPDVRKDWSYNEEVQRLNIFLTDTLRDTDAVDEPWGPLYQAIFTEIDKSNTIKKDYPVMVIMGNPPYNISSTNEYDLSRYKQIDGQPLDEWNLKQLQDDYVKFVLWSQQRIEKTGYGIVAFIMPHAYTFKVTFRGMRKSLMDTFDEIYILDLHGNVKEEHGKSPDGSTDENVFDIEQGVCIGIFVKRSPEHKTTIINHADFYGTRDYKFTNLESCNVGSIGWKEVTPSAPNYLFRNMNMEPLSEEYHSGYGVNEIFDVNSCGVATGNDKTTMALNEVDMINLVGEFASASEADLETKYGKPSARSGRGWTVSNARKDIIATAANKNSIVKVLYRPFDYRYTYYTGNSMGFHVMPRGEVMKNMHDGNIALVTTRLIYKPPFTNSFVTDKIADLHISTLKDSSSIFPLYVYGDDGSKTPNIKLDFLNAIKENLGLEINKDYTPEDVLAYVYAIQNSDTYRSKYAEFFTQGFPEIPLTSDVNKFRSLCKSGKSLIDLHRLDGVVPFVLKTSYPVKGTDIIEKSIYKDGKLYINAEQYFDGVPEEIYNTVIGGNQAIKKWIDARKGRKLEYTDLDHLKKMFNAIAFTKMLQQEIDKVIGDFPLK